MSALRKVKGDTIWEWPERDELGNCTRCHEHPLHCLCGEVVGHVKRYSLEELYELGRSFGEAYSYVGPYQKFLDWLEEQG